MREANRSRWGGKKRSPRGREERPIFQALELEQSGPHSAKGKDSSTAAGGSLFALNQAMPPLAKHDLFLCEKIRDAELRYGAVLRAEPRNATF
jgi:hypothetical protein